MNTETYSQSVLNGYPNELWRIKTVLQKVPFSKATLYRLILKGDFPRAIKLTSHISAWDSFAVIDWMNAKREGANNA